MVAVLLCPARVLGGETCDKECAGWIDCEIELVDCLVRTKRAREAVEKLKELQKEHPQNPAYARLLARAYLADGNPFWAQRVLLSAIERNPGDCESRSWLAWVHITQGDFDLAGEALEQDGCPAGRADKARWHLLDAYIARTEEHREEVARSLVGLERAGEIYAEDEQLWKSLRAWTNPGWIEPLSMRAEISGGYTSNARAGSPTDPSETGPGSGLGKFDLLGRLVLPFWRFVRPLGELSAKGHWIGIEEARDLSYMEIAVRPGMIIGDEFPRILVAYKADLLLINQDEKLRFYEGHRGEVELETSNGILVFLGTGRRLFREGGRTRTEIDGGMGWSYMFWGRLHLLLALAFRYHDAVGDPYDLMGGTALLAARVILGAGFYARLGVTPGLDHYLRSGGERGKLTFGTEGKRMDIATKLSAGLWSPALHGLRAGLTYDFTFRDSNADSNEISFVYREHRVLLHQRWTFDLNPWAPRVVSSKEHVELDYGMGGDKGSGLDQERIQDLLRQDEAARRGSSCVE